MKLSNPTEIKALLERHGFEFQKKFGQNFLINEAIPQKIANASLPYDASECACLEIGPGIGVMTVELSKLYKKVCAVEIDKNLLPLLDETLDGVDNVEIINSDVLKLDIASVAKERFGNMPCVVCANLPYYITTPVLMHLLESRFPFDNITVMVQKEVADRICSPAGSDGYGAITAAISYYAKPKKLFNVAAGNFIPRPDVTSAVLRLDLHKTPPVCVEDEEMLFKVIRGAFARRRKTLLNSMPGEFPELSKEKLQHAFYMCGLKGSERGETLDLDTFANIANAICKI
ncbi:MAG: 16S rRNA (adenine(1518)-N(6)/adenine(1519)-N(6))-dimethyltransferase RsmA [Ruminococcaceae bacterium]|nr:16S rRNA (adenine(1518)-N(6)/adenine(1519)-N(6))-dimethyltransferase RsmA [Oscillospiraceae bacterium]